MMARGPNRTLARRAQRGSVFLVVIAILIVLSLLILTLGYVAQVESYSARNWSDGIQARVAAFTGIPAPPIDPPVGGARVATTGEDMEPVRMELDLFLSRPVTPPKAPSNENTLRDAGVDSSEPLEPDNEFRHSLGTVWVEDESAKINLNTLLDVGGGLGRELSGFRGLGILEAQAPDPAPGIAVEAFGDFIEATLRAKGVESKTPAHELARAIALRRYGKDGKPGAAGVDDNGNGGSARLGSDGVDNDQDFVIDNPEEIALGLELDGLDNNRDGRIDEPGESIIDDGLDNDFDGRRDGSGEGLDDPAEFSPDPRRPPRGDDLPYGRLEELLSIKGMTPEVLAALSPHLTVFSVSQPAYADEKSPRFGYRQLDPNTAQPKEIFRRLREMLPSAPVDLIGQYVVNLIDRRDRDSVPTELNFDFTARTFHGIEITPYINEVYPDVASFDEDGDDGQYVELHNPYTRRLDLTGWRIEGGGATVRLRGSLAPDGYLVITDDFDDSRDPTPETESGQGSFFDLFGVVPAGERRQILEDSQFDLPNDSGSVRLFDPQGRLIDRFDYSGGRFSGATVSFQRIDPRLRYHERNYATPMRPNLGSKVFTASERVGLKIVEELHNRPFRSPLEVLLVSTSFVSSELSIASAAGMAGIGLKVKSEERDWVWRFPSIGLEGTGNLGARVVDLFMPGVAPPGARGLLLAASGAAGDRKIELPDSKAGGSRGQRRPSGPERRMREALYGAPMIFGRINLNTASPAVLATLPGIDPDLARKIAELREALTSDEQDDPNTSRIPRRRPRRSRSSDELDEWFAARAPTSPKRWSGLSKLIQDDELWGDLDALGRIAAVHPFSRLVTFHSLAYKATTESPRPRDEIESKRRVTIVRAQRILTLNQGRIESVSFQYLKPLMTADTDPDLIYAVLDPNSARQPDESQRRGPDRTRSAPRRNDTGRYEKPPSAPRTLEAPGEHFLQQQ